MVSKFIIGMTGAFGSGCTTIAKEFIVPQGFRYICLSDYLKKMCAEGKKVSDPDRKMLQIGIFADYNISMYGNNTETYYTAYEGR